MSRLTQFNTDPKALMVATSFANSPMPLITMVYSVCSAARRCELLRSHALMACVCTHNLFRSFLGFPQLDLKLPICTAPSFCQRERVLQFRLDSPDLIGKFANFVGGVLDVLDLGQP